MIHITEDNFVWLDVSEAMKHGHKMREEYWLAHELYAVFDDGSDSLLESHEEIDEALKLNVRVCIEGGHLKLNVRVCIEGGHLPKKYHPRNTWDGTDKILKDGYWYVKMADINLLKSK
jgi:hypothetical protein